MEKKLTAKVQKLNANLSEIARSFSNATIINPDDEASREKYGTLYTIYDVSGVVDLDTLLVTKIVYDVLHDSYYQAENTSPIQSLEKAVVSVREKVVELSSDKGSQSEFNILVAALWGNVLYLVQYGKGGSYLMRDGAIKPIQAASEGNFTVASGVVKDGDLVIVGTHKFLSHYPAESLVSTTQPISPHDLPLEASALILKFSVTTDFTSNEMLNFASQDGHQPRPRPRNEFTPEFVPEPEPIPVPPNAPPISMPTTVDRLENNITEQNTTASSPQNGYNGSISSPQPFNPSSGSGGFENISADFARTKRYRFKLPSLNFRKKESPVPASTIRRLNRSRSKLSRFVIPVVAVLFILSLGFTFLSSKIDLSSISSLFAGADTEQESGSTNSDTTLTESNTNGLIDPEEDLRNKVVRIDAPVFYDLKLVDPAVSPTTALVLDNAMVVGDATSGKVYESALDVAKFEAKPLAFPGLASFSYIDNNLAFTDNEGYKVYSLGDNTLAETYSDASLGKVSYSYLEFVYAIEGDVLNKYDKVDDALVESVWGQSSDFEGAKSMAIAINIYLLTSNDNVVSYLSGEKDATFTVSGLDTGLSNAKQLVADLDFTNIYIVDAGNNRVVVLNKEGELVGQIKHISSNVWSDIKAIGVSRNEQTLYVVAGTKIYKVDLSVLEPLFEEESSETEIVE